ncbi:MAG TPA: molybdenum cofactor guanylyltransferase [Candidatus Lokiarchaeia archaeon]|nr:molybdenum cofactor guanylyltransferase [Candidatus Lokiarchaeia archaeon]
MKPPVNLPNRFPSSIALVILAGGASRRYNGKQKALIDVGGQTIIDLQLNDLGSMFEHVYISIKNEEQKRVLREAGVEISWNVDFVQDLPEFPGNARDNAAIFGMYSAFSAIESRHALVISCDMPFVRQPVAQVLASYVEEDPDAIVPSWENGYLEPTLAIYKVENSRIAMKSLLEEGTYQLLEIFKRMDSVIYVPIDAIKAVDPDLDCLININDEMDLKKIKELTRFKQV